MPDKLYTNKQNEKLQRGDTQGRAKVSAEETHETGQKRRCERAMQRVKEVIPRKKQKRREKEQRQKKGKWLESKHNGDSRCESKNEKGKTKCWLTKI